MSMRSCRALILTKHTKANWNLSCFGSDPSHIQEAYLAIIIVRENMVWVSNRMSM